MKPFNLEEYLKNPSRKVVTRDGRKVTRFLCTDARGRCPIVALVENYSSTVDTARQYTKDGRCSISGMEDTDLFFAPEKHEGWIIINKWPDGERDTNGIIYDTELDVPNMSPVGGKRVATIKIEWEE